jgi:hypothetical protein
LTTEGSWFDSQQGKSFLLHSVQTGSGAHPTSNLMGFWCYFPRGNTACASSPSTVDATNECCYVSNYPSVSQNGIYISIVLKYQGEMVWSGCIGPSMGSGRVIAQADSRRLPTAAAPIRAHVGSSGICGGQSGTGHIFSEYFGFPCQFSFHRLLHIHQSFIIRGWYNRPNSGRRTKWTQSLPTTKKLKKKYVV